MARWPRPPSPPVPACSARRWLAEGVAEGEKAEQRRAEGKRQTGGEGMEQGRARRRRQPRRSASVVLRRGGGAPAAPVPDPPLATEIHRRKRKRGRCSCKVTGSSLHRRDPARRLLEDLGQAGSEGEECCHRI
ncbi:unnamed protein product [Miscanthus lutarioriparius]|uniref:Uncharacterized protein n=1 Tax=Miscanthus lutarioriparius TaxID=422564 RepID=A0A811PGI0_9POAL|nr:unnamed protein product [Miscanthus lutarioriparius]